MGTVDGDEAASRGSSGREERIFVSVRLRPLNGKEIARNDVCDWECISDDTVVFKNSNLPVPERSMYPTAYTFDRVFRSDCSTKQVYQEGAKEVALSVVNGINSTVFAYGQTSSGKTYTMCGITGYTIADIYDHVHKHSEREYHLKFSAMEIYNESVRDLLSTDTTPLRVLDDPERGTVVEKLTEESLRDWDHVMELLSICEAQRQSGETALNEASSRSHQIIRLTMESTAREFISKERSSTLAASVSFVDLAGSERASQSLSAGTRLKEGCHINRSLLTLGTVIRKLSKGRNGHIPFRDSKLTRILQSSLGGNARTAVICTMSPARSHVEQSRNTLLFASCAKEVTTNAQVNVVMSDKALLKHLQKEVARLESELKTPQSNFVVSHYTALLKAKDVQIEKLEKEVEDLTLQRDLAQTQVQNLLQLAAEDRDPSIKEGSNGYPHLRVRKSPDSDKLSEASPLALVGPRFPDIGVRTFERSLYSYAHSESSSSELSDTYIQIPHFEENHEASLRKLNSHSSLARSNSARSWDELEDQSSAASDDLCREVQCIDTISEHRSGSDRSSHHELVMEVHEDEESNQEEEEGKVRYISPSPEKPSPAAFIPRGKPSPAEFSPRAKPSPAEFVECPGSNQSSTLTESGSCKESFNVSPCGPWFEAVESSENTPPNGSEKEFVGRPDGIQRKLSELDFAEGVEPLQRTGSHLSVDSAVASEVEAEKEKPSSDDNITAISERNGVVEDVVEDKAELQEKAELREEKQVAADSPVHKDESKPRESFKDVKDIGLDPIEDDSNNSLSDWSSEFKRLQREIILLWDACNVSLVHRTYFFLLFRGDPSDSIYMEVERRRLSFLKDTFSRGIKAVDQDQTVSYGSSLKVLRREREMLAKQMQKRLSSTDRQSLYLKWGVKMSSKNRRLQLSSRLWTNTEDMDHIADSAFLIAKIMGMVEPGQAPKEMFGLNFTPQNQRRKTYSLKRSVISLL